VVRAEYFTTEKNKARMKNERRFADEASFAIAITRRRWRSF